MPSLRITTGTLRGRKIPLPPDTRPTSERARQAYRSARAEDKFVLHIQEKTGHAVTPAARQAALDWFAKWLKP